ncbi:SDR family NAD(P)-dependent oxidoreductase [Steroidobacter flavus]|uniref:SDR family NAD(P)-dependent oxidoreductase n=1 Tax=Steroidobacter flavus TaxID=1842136 RepID=A0ABV8T421_9GAMM
MNQARVAVVTGASSGIGKAAAQALATQGWRVIGLGRDPHRTAAAEATIRAAAPGANVTMIRADLSLMSEARRAAEEIISCTDRVDVLLNNAGGVRNRLEMTTEGLESTFASNHLGHFVLTTRLLPLLRAAAAQSQPGATRIVSVSSSGHERCPGLNWDDLQVLRNFTTGGAYTNAKLANILFTRALAKRLTPEGIVAHAMHPGVVDSNFVNHADDAMQKYMATLKDISLTPEVAADTLVWLATAEGPGRTSGGYYHQRAAVASSLAAQDEAAAERLWKESEALVARVLGGTQ